MSFKSPECLALLGLSKVMKGVCIVSTKDEAGGTCHIACYRTERLTRLELAPTSCVPGRALVGIRSKYRGTRSAERVLPWRSMSYLYDSPLLCYQNQTPHASFPVSYLGKAIGHVYMLTVDIFEILMCRNTE